MNPQIYDWIEAHIDLTGRELTENPHQRRPYYVHTVLGVADDMVKRGELIRVRPGLFRAP